MAAETVATERSPLDREEEEEGEEEYREENTTKQEELRKREKNQILTGAITAPTR